MTHEAWTIVWIDYWCLGRTCWGVQFRLFMGWDHCHSHIERLLKPKGFLGTSMESQRWALSCGKSAVVIAGKSAESSTELFCALACSSLVYYRLLWPDVCLVSMVHFAPVMSSFCRFQSCYFFLTCWSMTKIWNNNTINLSVVFCHQRWQTSCGCPSILCGGNCGLVSFLRGLHPSRWAVLQHWQGVWYHGGCFGSWGSWN